MNTLPANFGGNTPDKSTLSENENDLSISEIHSSRQSILRPNPLKDVDFNIISETIRCQNLKKQMNIRLMSLKRRLNNDVL